MGNPPFNPYYLGKLTELCPSIQWNIWKSLTTGKYPIAIEQASDIYPEIEKKIDREILNYKNRKQRQQTLLLLRNILITNVSLLCHGSISLSKRLMEESTTVSTPRD
ncbi:130_t:CDS:2 [Entrophospora sp. SA101]|nr:130_t:CDS:2 [Entrophospora sp. SA101]